MKKMLTFPWTGFIPPNGVMINVKVVLHLAVVALNAKAWKFAARDLNQK